MEPKTKRRARRMGAVPDNDTLFNLAAQGISVLFPCETETEYQRIYAAVSYRNKSGRVFASPQRYQFRSRDGIGCVELQTTR